MTTNNTYTPYRDMQAKLEQLQAFRGSSTTAVVTDSHYIVVSYKTPIFIFCTTTGLAIFDNSYYSTTTTRIQNLIKDAFGLHDCQERIKHSVKMQILSVHGGKTKWGFVRM